MPYGVPPAEVNPPASRLQQSAHREGVRAAVNDTQWGSSE